MKSIVKSITTLMILVISFTSAEFVNANTATTDTLRITPVEQAVQDNRMEKVLLYGLQSDVNGILEATFYNTIAYKSMNPEFTSDQLVERISEIAMDEKNHVVRYKAFLALSYLKDYEEFTEENERLRNYVESNNSTAAFQVIVEKLEDQQVAANK